MSRRNLLKVERNLPEGFRPPRLPRSPGVSLLSPGMRARAEYARRVIEAWSRSVAAIVQVGRVLLEAREGERKLRHGDFTVMVEKDLPFSQRTAERLMSIARHPVLSNPTHGSQLPASWRTLSELSRLSEAVLLAAIMEKKVHPEMERREAEALLDAGPRAVVNSNDNGTDGGMVSVHLLLPRELWNRVCRESFESHGGRVAASRTVELALREWLKAPDAADEGSAGRDVS